MRAYKTFLWVMAVIAGSLGYGVTGFNIVEALKRHDWTILVLALAILVGQTWAMRQLMVSILRIKTK